MLKSLRPFLGSLGVLPLVAVLWGVPPASADPGLDPRWSAALVWLIWAPMAWRAGRPGFGQDFATRALDLWRRLDPLVAGVLVYGVLFRDTGDWLVPAFLVAVLAGAIALLRRASGPVLLGLAVAFLVFGVIVPRAFRAALLSQIALTYQLDVDHRMWPDGREINSDSARFRGEATDLSRDDFVVLFLGDSFTYGFDLYYEQSYPYQLEALAREAGCSPALRAVNFGWTSASPLLGLRLLRQVGHKYHPDLVVYGLDMTDFHDDLRYEARLRAQDDFAFDRSAIVERLIATRLPWASGATPILRLVTDRLRGAEDPMREGLLAGLEIPGPRDRYFATAYPLERSRPAIELGVMKNLREIDAFARGVLGAKMALVVLPRAYQYSERESPRNWEAGDYAKLGPYVKEPFRYFESVAGSLPYPVVSLLPAFEASAEFPLYLASDPHWNARGAALAARTLLGELTTLGLVPCRGEGRTSPGERAR